jgi:TonB family protein
MNHLSIYDELDQAIDTMISQPESPATKTEAAVTELLQVASDLVELPRPDFKQRLKTEMEWVASGRPTSGQDRSAASKHARSTEEASTLASLFGTSYGAYPMRHLNFVASVGLHAIVMVLVVGSAFWFTQHVRFGPEPEVHHVLTMSVYVPNIPASSQPHGGGGGGGADAMDASKGALPRADDIQITPPVVVVRNEHPKLTADPTIIAPDLHVPQNDKMGDPLSALTNPSDGPGVRGGIGSDSGGGVGGGNGPGAGHGIGGNVGGGYMTVGRGVSAPRVIYDPDPEYSPEARAAKYQGTVKLWAIIGPDGKPHELRVERALGMGLDEKAIQAVRTWRFEPAQYDGHPVPVLIEVEVSFHLY